jgi:hypothetical protein
MMHAGKLIIAACLLSGAAMAETAGNGASCSTALAAGKPALSAEDHRRCMIAVAESYLDAEQGSAPADQAQLADDVSRHLLGTEPDHQAGNRARLVWEMGQTILGSLKDREWALEGDVVYVIYNAALKTNPAPARFAFSERLTIEKGLIRDIVLLAPSGIQ